MEENTMEEKKGIPSAQMTPDVSFGPVFIVAAHPHPLRTFET
jgi:hypothetical protein